MRPACKQYSLACLQAKHMLFKIG